MGDGGADAVRQAQFAVAEHSGAAEPRGDGALLVLAQLAGPDAPVDVVALVQDDDATSRGSRADRGEQPRRAGTDDKGAALGGGLRDTGVEGKDTAASG